MERPDSRLIRVFLSSTLVDFQEERSLLVQQVFPSLRRRARSREVEIVDVDLRWGVTAEQTERGETLPLCLGEIDRCRPYFISLLGERYGWVPPPAYYKPELLERQPWLKERMGGASVTELEILHGVLRNPEMAGHAFFYLRDPAYAQAQSEPGWVAENPAERQRLEALKALIRASGFPVAEGLPSPQAIAERIEADLWQLIESRFPEHQPADALEREERRHSDYRRARTGLYLRGGPAIEKLESWIADGEQRILITGDSGAGKSALIANWLKAHQWRHPQDLVHAHHLGCTNDASAVRPLLGRLIDTASKLLLQEQQISEAIQVPQDWWELVFKVSEVFALLSPWCERQGRRWILVLDGLDRLAEDDQQALPWIPTTIPPGIHVVASALECPARSILQERQYCTHQVGQLGMAEQQQLIELYLSQYAKQLESGLQQQILAHRLAGSPLYLRVLLEELRQCAWFDTLQAQLEFYLTAETIDGLYAKVLERLEINGHGEATRKALTALWASRAGLSEEELLAITGLAPLQWAPIDLALAGAFGRNGNRVVFGHEYLRKAVTDRFLLSEEEQKQAHSALAAWYQNRDGWDERDSEELPWQLQRAGLLQPLRDWLLQPLNLAILQRDCGSREVLSYWFNVKAMGEGDLDELITNNVERVIEKCKEDADELVSFVNCIANLLDEVGLYRELLLRLKILSLELEEAADDPDQTLMLRCRGSLALAYKKMGHYGDAELLYLRCLEASERLVGPDHLVTLCIVDNLASLYIAKGDYERAEAFCNRVLEARERMLGPEHPDTLGSINDLAVLYHAKGDYERAEAFFDRCLEANRRLLGPEHSCTLTTVNNLGCLYMDKGDYEQAESFFVRVLEARERTLGPEHPSSLVTVSNLGSLYSLKGDDERSESFFIRDLEASERLLGPDHPDTLSSVNKLGNLYRLKGDYEQAEAFFIRCLEARERLLGPEHPDTLSTVNNLGCLYMDKGDDERSESFFIRDLEASERLLGPEHPDTLITVNNLGCLYMDKGDYERSESFFIRALEASERLLGPEHPDTLITVSSLGNLYRAKGDYERAEVFFIRALEASERLLGPEHPDTLITVSSLGNLYRAKGDYERGEAFFNRCLEARERLLGPEHSDTNLIRFHLAGLYSDQGRQAEAIPLRRRDLAWCQKHNGDSDPDTLHSLNQLAIDLRAVGELEEAEILFRRLLKLFRKLLDPDDFNIGRALGDLAKTLEQAGKMEEAIIYAQEALTHRLEHEGVDAWWTNRSRLNLARVLHKLECSSEAINLLDHMERSMNAIQKPDEEDEYLLVEAIDLRHAIMDHE